MSGAANQVSAMIAAPLGAPQGASATEGPIPAAGVIAGVIEIILPVPPTTNELWAPVRTKRGAKMVARMEYADWKAMAKREVEAQRDGARIPWMFRAAIVVPAGRHDADNLIKPALDACQAGGAIVNDKFCLGGSWDVDDTREGTVLVVLTPIPPIASAPRRKQGPARKEPTS